MHVCSGVSVRWGAAVEQTQVSSNAAPCLHSNANGAFKRRVQSNFFLFFLQRYLLNKIITNTTHKLKYLHTYLQTENIYKNTSTPPPNLKRHIAHNVTKLTNLGNGPIQV
jgi:hypothetical protein